jgi:oligogalacturonide lyase
MVGRFGVSPTDFLIGCETMMRFTARVLAALVMAASTCSVICAQEKEPPVEWTDAKTGHRVVRLSREPGSASLYFHQYPYSADGKKLIFSAPTGIWTVNLDTRELDQVVEGSVQPLLTGFKTGDVYYIRWTRGRSGGDGFRLQGDVRRQPDFRQRGGRGGVLYAANLETHAERRIAELPAEYGGGNVAINADETMVVGVGRDPEGSDNPRTPPESRFEGRLLPGWSSGSPRLLYTIDVATGETNVLHRSNDWLNHLQCSPTDPGQIMYCHEGPWHYVDRTWLIRTDGSKLTQVHPRTMDMEIEGHEFFSRDGKTVWYDLQTPRSLVFWLAGYEIATGKRTWYHLERDEWSVHYNISPDGTLFAGDGGGPASVANMSPSHETLNPPGNGQWIYLFRPKLITMTGLPEVAAKQIKIGTFESERLVDMGNHDYSLEPNVTFTPDGKWIVFRSNMHGPSHVYAVEIAEAK